MTDFHHIMTGLIRHYIVRQRVIPRALLDISPRHLFMVNDESFKKTLRTYIELYDSNINSMQNLNIQSGAWQEWRYWIHGIGCKLVHVQTSEPLEWDVPELNGFRFDWFWEHLLWRLNHERDDNFVKEYVTSEYSQYSEMQIFTRLSESGIIYTRIDGISFLT